MVIAKPATNKRSQRRSSHLRACVVVRRKANLHTLWWIWYSTRSIGWRLLLLLLLDILALTVYQERERERQYLYSTPKSWDETSRLWGEENVLAISLHHRHAGDPPSRGAYFSSYFSACHVAGWHHSEPIKTELSIYCSETINYANAVARSPFVQYEEREIIVQVSSIVSLERAISRQ